MFFKLLNTGKIMFKLLVVLALTLFSLNVQAKDYANINFKFFKSYNNSDLNGTDKSNNFLEVEGMAKTGQWDFYGFTDLKFSGTNSAKANYDFYKYIVRYDVLNDSKLYIVGEAKETYNYEGDSFIGIGTSYSNLPLIGTLDVNGMYFLSKRDNNDVKVNLPFMIQFAWYKNFGKIGNSQLSLYQDGWSDIDIFEKRKDSPKKTNPSLQFYQGIGINYKTYGFEVAYKYWYNISGGNEDSNSLFAYLIKRF